MPENGVSVAQNRPFCQSWYVDPQPSKTRPETPLFTQERQPDTPIHRYPD